MPCVVTFFLILLSPRSHDVRELSLAGDKAEESHVLTEYMGCEVDVGVMPRLRKEFIRFGAKDELPTCEAIGQVRFASRLHRSLPE